MSRNDYAVRADGSIRQGDLGIESLERARELLEARIQTVKDEALPMLKGTGFLVIDPSNPRFDGEEHTDVEEAKLSASNVAYKSGVAIVYAPIAVMRPKREVAEFAPSKLLQQLGSIGGQIAAGPVVDVPAPGK